MICLCYLYLFIYLVRPVIEVTALRNKMTKACSLWVAGMDRPALPWKSLVLDGWRDTGRWRKAATLSLWSETLRDYFQEQQWHLAHQRLLWKEKLYLCQNPFVILWPPLDSLNKRKDFQTNDKWVKPDGG